MQNQPIETLQAKKKERFKIIPAVYLLLKDENGNYLLGLRKNTGYADGFWGIPAGHLDGNETVRQGLKREAEEELGIHVDVEDMKVVLSMHRLSPSRECVDFFIEIGKWSGNVKINEPDKCEKLEFFSIDKLPENLIPQEKYAFEMIKKGETYCEYGW